MRRRIVVLAVLAAMLAIGLFGIPLGAAMAQFFLDDQQLQLQQVADAAAIAAAYDLARGQIPTDLPVGAGAAVGVYSVAGVKRSGAGPRLAEPVVRRAASGRTTSSADIEGQLVIAVPVGDHDRSHGGVPVAGIVRVAGDYAGVRERIVGTWAGMLALAAAAVALTGLLARRQARRLAAPLEALSEAAGRLGAGDFDVRTRPGGIPEIDSAGASLNTTATRLGDLLARERAFSAHASHQLRTPLTGLRLQLETALTAPAGDPRDVYTGALDSVDRLEQTITDLLALARDVRPATGPLAVDELLAELTDTWRPALAARGRALNVRAEARLPVSGASAAAVRQILGVLVDNAVTHGAGTVSVRARDAETALAVDVGDEGQGIPAGRSPFDRRDENGAGHGIGLPLARALAEAEGGRLVLTRPRPPVFTLLLPAHSVDQPEG